MDNRAQVKKLLQEVGIPTTAFCKKIGISTTAFYRWLRDDLRLSDEKERTIRIYANKLSELF